MQSNRKKKQTSSLLFPFSTYPELLRHPSMFGSRICPLLQWLRWFRRQNSFWRFLAFLSPPRQKRSRPSTCSVRLRDVFGTFGRPSWDGICRRRKSCWTTSDKAKGGNCQSCARIWFRRASFFLWRRACCSKRSMEAETHGSCAEERAQNPPRPRFGLESHREWGSPSSSVAPLRRRERSQIHVCRFKQIETTQL